MIFGWGGKSRAAPRRPGPARVLARRSTRSCASRRATSRSSSSAARARSGGSSSRSAAVPTPSSRSGSPTRSRVRHDATVAVLHLVPPGITEAVRAQAEHALAAFVRQHVTAPAEPLLREAANVRTAILREAEQADLVVMGASAPPGDPTASVRCSGRCRRRSRQRAKPTVIVVKTREPIGRQTFEQLAQQAETLAAADRAAEESRAVPARVDRWFARVELPPLRVRRPAAGSTALKEKQGLTVSPRPADAQRGGDDRPDRAARDPRDAGALPAPRRDPRHRLRVDRRHARDRRGRGRPRGPAPRRPAALRLVPGQGRGALEVALRDDAATSSSGPTPTSATGTRGWSTGRSARCSIEPRLQYVKGYYQRPIVEGGVLKEGGGGRVTELVARPLINLFFPELSGLIQPLAGEYAGRRSLLEQIPFFTGYAVEIGHLIDAAERVGIERPRPGRPRAAGPPQPGARGAVADVVRDPPGGHEAARGAAAGAAVRGARARR